MQFLTPNLPDIVKREDVKRGRLTMYDNVPKIDLALNEFEEYGVSRLRGMINIFFSCILPLCSFA